MTAAGSGTWMPTGVRISAPRWWIAVVTGIASPLISTPVADLLPPAWRVAVAIALPLVAVICGLPPTVLRAGGERPGHDRAFGWALVLTVALVLVLVAGVPLLLLTADDSLLAAAGVATAAHLVAGRIVSGLLHVLPGGTGVPAGTTDEARTHASDSGATRPGASAPATVEKAGESRRLDLGRWVDLTVRWSAVPIGLLALLAFAIAWIRLAPQAPGALAAIVTATVPSAAVLLAASPAAFLLARHVPGCAARDRGRELGIVFGDVGLRRVARIRALVLDPVGVVTDRHPRLVAVRPAGRLQVTAALQAAASVAAAGNDPTHVALVAAARERGIPLRPVEVVPSPHGSHTAGTPAPLRGRIKDTVVTLGPAEVFERIPATSAGEPATLHVGWGGVARAAFVLLPQVRSQALVDRPELTALRIAPVLVGADPAVLRHVGDALEIPERGRCVLTGPVAVHDLVEEFAPAAREATTAVLLTGALGTAAAPATDATVVFAPGSPMSADRSSTGADVGPHTVHIDPGDLATTLRAVGLARKAGRVTTQGLVLTAIIEVAALGAAALGMLDPQYAAVVGSGLPVVVTANALRPRSYGRGDVEPEGELPTGVGGARGPAVA